MRPTDRETVSRFLYAVAMAHLSVSKRNLTHDEVSEVLKKVYSVLRGQIEPMMLAAIWRDVYTTACADLDIPPWV